VVSFVLQLLAGRKRKVEMKIVLKELGCEDRDT
jgi:hypothetical protein